MSYQAFNEVALAGAAAGGIGGAVAINATSFEGYNPQEPPAIDIGAIQLPAPNMACYQEPPQPRPEVRYFKVEEPTVQKTITQNFNTSKTVVKENVNHHQHIKNVIINVTRNHWHTQRIVLKDNNYHHYLINNVVRVADVHHQKIETVKGESKSFNDYKQTQRVEAAECVRGSDTGANAIQVAGGSAANNLSTSDESAIANIIAGAAGAYSQGY